jgi:hypothetical protein
MPYLYSLLSDNTIKSGRFVVDTVITGYVLNRGTIV